MDRKTIWAIVALVGGYILAVAVANVGATRLVEIGGVVIPGGTFMFAVTFTLRDLLHKRLGKEWAIAAIFMAGAFSLLQAVYLAGVAALPWPVFYSAAEGWNTAFALVPAITVGGIIAQIVSELVDTEVYHQYVQRFGHRHQWARVLLSNAISVPLDSLVFAVSAFVVLPHVLGGQALPLTAALALTSGQILYKYAVAMASIPGIYLVKERRLVEDAR